MELLSLPHRRMVAGLGIVLCSGPFSLVPGGSVMQSSTSSIVLGCDQPEKSSLAWSLNSTSSVRSLAVRVVFAFL